MRKFRIVVNWLVYITVPLWVPPAFFLIEIYLIPRMLRTPKENRCPTYRALFEGSEWFVTWSDVKDILENS